MATEYNKLQEELRRLREENERLRGILAKHGIEYRERMKKMIKSVECCGYGFPDILWDFYYEYAGE